MHIFVVAEGWSDETGLKRFEKEWHGRIYANGKAKLRVREVKLYTLGINEEGREEFLKDLKGLTKGCNNSFDKKGCTVQDGTFHWSKMVKWTRGIARLFGVTPIDDSKVIANDIWAPGNPLASNAHFVVIGEVKDHRTPAGVEQV